MQNSSTISDNSQTSGSVRPPTPSSSPRPSQKSLGNSAEYSEVRQFVELNKPSLNQWVGSGSGNNEGSSSTSTTPSSPLNTIVKRSPSLRGEEPHPSNNPPAAATDVRAVAVRRTHSVVSSFLRENKETSSANSSKRDSRSPNLEPDVESYATGSSSELSVPIPQSLISSEPRESEPSKPQQMKPFCAPPPNNESSESHSSSRSSPEHVTDMPVKEDVRKKSRKQKKTLDGSTRTHRIAYHMKSSDRESTTTELKVAIKASDSNLVRMRPANNSLRERMIHKIPDMNFFKLKSSSVENISAADPASRYSLSRKDSESGESVEQSSPAASRRSPVKAFLRVEGDDAAFDTSLNHAPVVYDKGQKSKPISVPHRRHPKHHSEESRAFCEAYDGVSSVDTHANAKAINSHSRAAAVKKLSSSPPKTLPTKPEHMGRHIREHAQTKTRTHTAQRTDSVSDRSVIDIHEHMIEHMGELLQRETQLLEDVKRQPESIKNYREVMPSFLDIQLQLIQKMQNALASNYSPEPYVNNNES